MQRARIIPVLTVDNGKLVKTVKFKKPNYIGDPINAIKIFNDKMVDEIVVLDITASRDNRPPNFDLIYEMAGECFSPLGYGGGIKSFEDAKKVFTQGVEKVIINSAIAGNASLVTSIADTYGNQSVVVSLDVKKPLFGSQKLCFKSASDTSKEEIIAFARRMESIGAGELIVHQTERDGTFTGLDRELTKMIVDSVNIPVIACGGASSVEDMNETISETGASAAAAGSIFVYKDRNPNSILISYPTPEDIISR